MTKKTGFLLAAALFASGPVLAGDNRIKTLPYDAEEIVSIVGFAGIQSTVQFGPDERIENVAVGDSSAWQITPNRRGTLLFVKPLASTNRTNMTVVTDKRTYMFDLSAGGKAGPPLYVLKFTYQDLPPAQVAPVEPQALVMASASIPTTASTSPERLNFDWKVKGYSRLRPARIFDDGASLYLSWPSGVELPAILTAAEKGREAPLDYRVAGEYIVLTPVPANIVLRHGSKAVTVWTTRRLGASGSQTNNPKPDPVLQRPETIATDGRFAVRTALASPTPQHQSVPAVRQPLAATNSVKAPDAADLLSDKLMDGHHDH